MKEGGFGRQDFMDKLGTNFQIYQEAREINVVVEYNDDGTTKRAKTIFD